MFFGISFKKSFSIFMLLAIIVISLALGQFSNSVNQYASKLPILEGLDSSTHSMTPNVHLSTHSMSPNVHLPSHSMSPNVHLPSHSMSPSHSISSQLNPGLNHENKPHLPLSPSDSLAASSLTNESFSEYK
jgi:hypothetical protein